MKMMLRSVLLLIGFFFFYNCPAQTKEDRPNFLFIYSDDQYYGDNGCYGSSFIKTPNIDRLASEGMLLKNAYSCAVYCAPARSAIHTGMFPLRNGCSSNQTKLKKGTKTLPSYFLELGYEVGHSGKLHLPVEEPLEEAYPFEFFLDPTEEAKWKNPVRIEDVENFIKRERSAPFFMMVNINDPHTPWPIRQSGRVQPEMVDLPGFLIESPMTLEKYSWYANDVENMDDLVGKCLALLDKYQLSDNTIVIYSSDQGPQVPFAKGSCYDACLHVPLIVRCPNRIPSASKNEALLSTVDLLPTLLELAGGQAPENIDGKSFLKVLENKTNKHREAIFALLADRYRAIRTLDYKLIINIPFEERMGHPYGITNSNYTFDNKGMLEDMLLATYKVEDKVEADRRMAKIKLFHYKPEYELYNLKDDPHEWNNLSENESFKKTIKQLVMQLNEWREQQQDPTLTLNP